MSNKNWNSHFGRAMTRKQVSKLHRWRGLKASNNIPLLFSNANNECSQMKHKENLKTGVQSLPLIRPYYQIACVTLSMLVGHKSWDS